MKQISKSIVTNTYYLSPIELEEVFREKFNLSNNFKLTQLFRPYEQGETNGETNNCYKIILMEEHHEPGIN